MKTMISIKEMMTIVTIVGSSETMMTTKTMISNKEMFTIVTFVSSSVTMMTTIRNQESMTNVIIVSSTEAI